MTGDHVRRRHVWVDGAGGYRRPGLVITWRRNSGTEWEAYVARVHGDGEALITWEPASNLTRSLTTDGHSTRRIREDRGITEVGAAPPTVSWPQ